jgi:3-keto-5-aminohexanoate cleavage enzyme
MATVDVGVVVFMRDGEERVTLWTRSFNKHLVNAMLKKGVKPEFEVYGLGGMVEVDYLISNIPELGTPYWFNFPLGMQRTAQNVTPFSPKNMIHLVEQLPRDSMFMAMGVGAEEIQATVQAILLGGHVRVGFEDNYYYSKGVLAKSNAELVARIARIGRDLGRTVAKPSEARLLLNIPETQKDPIV